MHSGTTLPKSNENDDGKPELSKREKRRAREAAKKAKQEETEDGPTQERCNVCKEEFTSRTKLFTHIKETGHALAAPAADDDKRQARSSGGGGKKTGKGKKR